MFVHLLTLLALGASLVAAATQPTYCTKLPYQPLQVLSGYAAAQTFCSKNYPQAAITSTSTALATTVTTIVATTTIDTTADTSTLISTVPTISIETITTQITPTAVETSTVSGPPVDFSPAAKVKRAATSTAALHAQLTRLASAIAKSACACIQKPATRTTTVTPTAVNSVTATSFRSVTATATTSIIVPITLTTTQTETAATIATTLTITTQAQCPSSSPTSCSGNCKDLQNDKFNCGSCGNRCIAGFACERGQCFQPQACTPSGTFCSGGNQGCACYATTEGLGYCGINGGLPGRGCGSSDDCDNGFSCADGACFLPQDRANCPDGSRPSRLFRRRDISDREVSSAGRLYLEAAGKWIETSGK